MVVQLVLWCRGAVRTKACIVTAPFPFLPFMVQDLGYSVVDTGYYVGVVAAGRFFGNFLTSWLWGLLADRLGQSIARHDFMAS